MVSFYPVICSSRDTAARLDYPPDNFSIFFFFFLSFSLLLLLSLLFFFNACEIIEEDENGRERERGRRRWRRLWAADVGNKLTMMPIVLRAAANQRLLFTPSGMMEITVNKPKGAPRLASLYIFPGLDFFFFPSSD